MQITVKRTGGVGAPATDATWGPIDTDQAGDLGSRLRQLVDALDFFNLKDIPEGGVRDDQYYTVEVVDGDRNHQVSYGAVGSHDVPAELKEIVRLAEENVEPAQGA